MKKFKLDEKVVLKLIALVLAITTWIYVNGILQKSFGPRMNTNTPNQEKSNSR